MAALLPAIAGLASAASAVASKAKGKQRRRQPARRETRVVLYDKQAAARSVQRTSRQRNRAKRSVGHMGGVLFKPTGLQSAAFIGRSSFAPCGPANKNSEISSDGSLKIRGHGLLGRTGFPNLPTGQVVVANLGATTGVLQTNVSTVSQYTFVGPGSLDPRLLNIAGIYSYYVIRKLDLQYVPAVSQYNYVTGTAPNAQGSASLMTLGLTDQSDYIGSAPPTNPQQIADLPSSCTGPLYQPMSLQYKTDASRVYYCSSNGNGSDTNESFQLALCGLLAALPPTGTANVNVGSFHADWEIDFYRPMYPQTSVSAPEEKRRHLAKAGADMSEVKDMKGYSSMAAAPSVPPLVRVSSTDSLAQSEQLKSSQADEKYFPPGGPRPSSAKPIRLKG